MLVVLWRLNRVEREEGNLLEAELIRLVVCGFQELENHGYYRVGGLGTGVQLLLRKQHQVAFKVAFVALHLLGRFNNPVCILETLVQVFVL